jgi:hypothetical protein
VHTILESKTGAILTKIVELIVYALKEYVKHVPILNQPNAILMTNVPFQHHTAWISDVSPATVFHAVNVMSRRDFVNHRSATSMTTAALRNLTVSRVSAQIVNSSVAQHMRYVMNPLACVHSASRTSIANHQTLTVSRGIA